MRVITAAVDLIMMQKYDINFYPSKNDIKMEKDFFTTVFEITDGVLN